MALKTLVVYYSYEGSTRLIAQTIATTLQTDILECKPIRDISSKGLMKYAWGGRQVIFKKRPVLEAFQKNPLDYDTIILGTPVWAFTYAPAIRSFLSQVSLQQKNIAVFCCHEGGMGNTLVHLKEALPNNTIIGENDFSNVVRNKEANILKAQTWAATLQRK